jgi:transcriptional regulator GlxA family with amidase domain
VTDVYIVSLPGHRILDRLAFVEVMHAAQATCAALAVTSLDVRSASEAWKLHQAGDIGSGGAIAVIGPWAGSPQDSYLEQHLVGVLARAWRADVTLCMVGSTEFLARSGLLTGRTVVCAQQSAALMRLRHPSVVWDDFASCAAHGNLVSAAGLLAGYEAALTVVEALGPSTLTEQLIRSLRVQHKTASPGMAGPQVSRPLHPAVQRALSEIHGASPRRWTIAALAKSACVSERHLQRLFKSELGCGILDYLQRWRLSNAVRMMERQPRESLERVAEACGFTSVQQLRRIWRREYGQAPSHSRRRSSLRGALGAGLQLLAGTMPNADVPTEGCDLSVLSQNARVLQERAA